VLKEDGKTTKNTNFTQILIMKKRILILFLFLSLLPSIKPDFLFDLLLNKGFSWLFSYLSNWFVVLILTGFAVYFSFKVIERYRILIGILIFVIPLSVFFAVNPIYESDLKKKGLALEIENNPILVDVLRYAPEFDGLVCIASSGCPYCVMSVRETISKLHMRKKNADVLIFLPRGDESTIKNFREKSGAMQIPIIVSSLNDGKIHLDIPGVPAFIYIKNNKIIHQWSIDNLGYRALDWIENGLN
jgi:hypothetical protein